MKFIHTADLHIGNSMHGVNREKEYTDFFRWLKETIVENEAETLVIAGDVYDIYNPSNEARSMLDCFLASLLNTCCKNVIVVAGNHDSGAVLESNKEVMEALNIHVVGNLSNDVEKDIFKLYDQHGEVCGICVAIPFTRESELKAFCEEDVEGVFGDIATKNLYDRALEEARRLRGECNVPIIATGHLYAANLEGRYENRDQFERQEDGVRPIDVVGNLGSIHSSAFSDEYAYIALGHIHYTSMVAGNPKIRYSGSPVVMGFDEAGIERSVLLVECAPGQETRVDRIPIPQSCHYKRLSGRCEEIERNLLGLDEHYEDDKKIYVEVRYHAGESNLVNQMLLDIELPERVEVVSRKLIRANVNTTNGGTEMVTMSEIRNLDPADIFRRRIMQKLEIDDSIAENQGVIDRYLGDFLQAYDEVQRGDNGNENN